MLTSKQNVLETLKIGGKPDRLVNQYRPYVLVQSDPVYQLVRGNRARGKTTKDVWGTEIAWPEDQHAAMPHVTEENKVLKDITKWRELKVPDLAAAAKDPASWEPALKAAAAVDHNEKLVMGFMGTGVFEQLHFLMGFEDTLANMLMEPEAMAELVEVVGEYRFTYMKLLVDNLKPDIILSHDDWGSKNSMFMNPDTWREIIKPQYVKIYGYAKEHGVKIMHHADSFLEPIVEDMVELGIDIWQGVLPQNDIVKLQKQLKGRMVLMGGIDAAIVDWPNTPEDVIRKEVRRACATYGPGGGFIPSLTYGGPGSIFPNVDATISDEIERYNKEVYGVHE
ncbi:Uroporphyrinogen decarboxylase (URO-D) [Sporobacter termitidis DSM 10068]|uniref:Uroporphyrinogen decarboxylase (URO-D) n=1 Tax=Sporobacter termitidis DSM 10068 TaxID=1123282 RepID=A0A1M5UDD2_9FIRM|nr:uroporphyrinogen decarboxylase family protein [Sporobacter termitidis]SHH61075.1 Uroporphyrinogen decarboxylase (URO-D) [Sporobacter termitidis DSM 10068]